MVKPVASIIIPTHDRSSTLSASIASALGQSEKNIEVIVVGDGCTEECREIATSWNRHDERMVFMDLPKAPFRGVANRDKAVRSARSNRVFYNDDDDLLLPHHVETLAPFLDHFDVVDTPVVSISPDGSVHIGIHDCENSTLRRLLADGTLKPVFDTHMAHRKSAYVELGAPWNDAKDKLAVWHMLRAFAGSETISWHTTRRITALSFHGARRVTMRDTERKDEIELWLERLENPGLERDLRESASLLFHLFNLLNGMSRGEISKDQISSTALDLCNRALDQTEKRDSGSSNARSAIGIFFGEKAAKDEAVHILKQLTVTRYGPAFTARNAIHRFRPHYSFDELLELLHETSDEDGLATALLGLTIAVRQGADVSVMLADIEDRFCTAPSCDAFGFAAEATEILYENETNRLEAWKWSGLALEQVPRSHHALPFWRLRRDLAASYGQNDDIETAEAMIAQLEQSMV